MNTLDEKLAALAREAAKEYLKASYFEDGTAFAAEVPLLAAIIAKQTRRAICEAVGQSGAIEALDGVISVSGRHTIEFNRARNSLAALRALTTDTP